MSVGRPKKYADDRTNTTVRISPDLLATLDQLADDRDVSRNWLMCRLLQRGVEQLASAPTDPENPRWASQ